MLKGKSEKYRNIYKYFDEQCAKFRMMQANNLLDPITYQYCEKKTSGRSKPLKSLKLISIREMKIGTVHKGCYLKVKIIHKPFKLNSIAILMEDHLGEDCIDLSIYNFDTKGKHYDHYFSKGTVFYIKEPFYKIANSGVLIIRIDDPSDVIFEGSQQAKDISLAIKAVEPESAEKIEISKLEEYRLQGLDFIKNEEFVNAYAIYTSALQDCKNDEYITKFKMNKAIVCLRLNLVKSYGQIISSVLQVHPKNIKALYHTIKFEILSGNFQKGKTMIEMTEFDAVSREDLTKFLKIQSSFKAMKIDWYRAIKFGEVGEFFHEGIRIDKCPYGLGIFAMRKFKAGQFLIIQKPLMTNSKAGNKKSDFSLNYDSTHEDSVKANIMKLYHLSDEFKEKFNLLSSSFSIEIKKNGLQSVFIDQPKKFGDIVSSNWFQMAQLEEFFSKQHQNHGRIAGIYEKISMLNHSCEYNCERFCLGTTMIVYCVRDLDAGEELLINYKAVIDGQVRRKELKNWGIDCNCIFCVEQMEEMKGRTPKKCRSIEMKKLKLMKEALLKNKPKDKLDQLEQFWDIRSIACMSMLINDYDRSAKMLRRVFSLTEDQSKELIQKWRGT